MSNDKDIPMKYSRTVHEFSVYPKPDSDIDFIKNINHEVEKHNIDLIMPIFEFSTKIILKHKSSITSIDKLVLLPSFDNLQIANNKGVLNKHLEKNNLPCPKSQIIQKDIKFDISTIEYPVLLKPTESIGGGGIYVFNNKNALVEFLNSDKFDCTYLVQY